jgi:hypothetical protein
LEVVSSGFANVRFGSEADIETSSPDGRFTPESRHQLSALGCPLSAILEIMRGKKTVWRTVLVQAGALLINHIAPRRRTLTPSA